MNIWIDAQLSPGLTTWLGQGFGVQAVAVRDLDLAGADDETIFAAARQARAIVITKDRDFVNLLDRHGPPPQIIWLTCGNTSEQHLRSILKAHFQTVLRLLQTGEAMVEISG